MSAEKISILLVEDNERLRTALSVGLEQTDRVIVVGQTDRAEAALDLCLTTEPAAIIMDVQLSGSWNGIQGAVAIRRELPRLPVVFYSIQDNDNFYRDFLESGILSHFAYVKKSNYLLPESVIDLLEDVISGKSIVDPEIESRVTDVRRKTENSPLGLLEPNERKVAEMLAGGLSNEQMARIMGFKDKRTIARINGQIYNAWGLNENKTDEKVARTRAALIVQAGRMIAWDDAGNALVEDFRGEWVAWTGL